MNPSVTAAPVGERDAIARLVRMERLRVLFSASATAVVPAMLLAVVTAGVLWRQVSHSLVLLWCLLVCGSYGVRNLLAARHRDEAAKGSIDVERWDRRAITVYFAAGVAWGSLGVLPLDDGNMAYHLFVGFVLSGVVASATASIGTHQPSTFAFVLPAVVPLGIHMFTEQNPIGQAIAVMILLHLVLVIGATKRVQTHLTEGVQLRLESEHRGQELAQSRAQLLRHERLTRAIAAVQAQFIRDRDERQLFTTCLQEMLALADGERGCIGEIEISESGTRYCEVRALGSVNGGAGTAQGHEAREFERFDVDEWFESSAIWEAGAIATPAAFTRWNASRSDSAPCSAALALPLRVGTELIGFAALVRTTGTYEAAMLDYLRPIANTVAQIIAAVRAERERRLVEVRLDRTRAQLETCVIDTPAAVAMLDRDLRFVAASRRWCGDFGLGEQVVNGKLLYECVPEMPPRWRESLASVLTGCVAREAEDPFIRSNGTVRWLNWEARPWYESGCQVGGLVLFTEDVTDRKKSDDALHARERLLEQLTDQVPGMLYQQRIHIDGRMSMLYVSSGAMRVLGVQPDTLFEAPEKLFSYCHHEDRGMLAAAQARAAVTGLLRLTFRAQFPSGDVRWLAVEASATRLADQSTLWHGYIESIADPRGGASVMGVGRTAGSAATTEAIA